MKKMIACLFCALLLGSHAAAFEALTDDDIDIEAPSAVLMEKTTGTVIYEKNAHEKLAPASVTKVMTMLLIVEELEKGTLTEEDTVTTSARAASMGGSQIYLEEGEQMTVRELFKSLAVSSANDAAVALAEHISGTEQAFVDKMNQRAAQLGMVNTFFCDCTGLLEAEEHLTTAYDVALMSRELIQHELVKEYTKIWMDTVRNGEFGLSNTNKLIYYYEGSTGLKTGFTNKAMYCLAATAQRDGIEYIAVVMRVKSSDIRFDNAKTLLNYAFANHSLAPLRPGEALPPVYVELGKTETVQPVYNGPEMALINKSSLANISYDQQLPEKVSAPVEQGQQLGTLTVYDGEKQLAAIPIVAADPVERMGVFSLFADLCLRLTGFK